MWCEEQPNEMNFVWPREFVIVAGNSGKSLLLSQFELLFTPFPFILSLRLLWPHFAQCKYAESKQLLLYILFLVLKLVWRKISTCRGRRLCARSAQIFDLWLFAEKKMIALCSLLPLPHRRHRPFHRHHFYQSERTYIILCEKFPIVSIRTVPLAKASRILTTFTQPK